MTRATTPSRLRRALLAAGAALLAGSPAAAAPAAPAGGWTKTYVVEWYENAFYYGAKTGVVEPGTDCPAGNTEPDWPKIFMRAGYDDKDAHWINDPGNPGRSPIHHNPQVAFRGAHRENVYLQPYTVAEDPADLPAVSGKVGEGFDLDGNRRNGFVSPTGDTGVDNNFYRALGCWKTYRGPPRKSNSAESMNDNMRQGGWTVLIVVSGHGKDPMNDRDVDVAFYSSPDKVVKDGSGEVAHDYSFRIKPDATYEGILKAKTVGGVITGSSPEITLREPAYNHDLQLLKAQVRLKMEADGSLSGLIGGYRPWLPAYKGWVNGRGPVIEALTWVQLPDVYYALKHYADYSPTGPDGEKTHISYAMRVQAAPAFVMEPDGARQIAGVRSFKASAPRPAPAWFVDGGAVPLPQAAKPAMPTRPMQQASR